MKYIDFYKEVYLKYNPWAGKEIWEKTWEFTPKEKIRFVYDEDQNLLTEFKTVVMPEEIFDRLVMEQQYNIRNLKYAIWEYERQQIAKERYESFVGGL